MYAFNNAKQPGRPPVTTPIPRHEQGSQNGGMDDGGGGSGHGGKPLEDFAVNLESVEEFKSYIEPIILNLEKNNGRLAGDIKHLIRARRWYFIPGALKSLPQTLIGTYFETDTYAIQNLDEVWFNSLAILPGEPKAKLILHELIMGVRLLAFVSKYETCLTLQARKPDYNYDAYRMAKKVCRKKYPLRGVEDALTRKDLNLTKRDYALIREITLELFDHQGNVADDFESELEYQGFREFPK